MENNEDRVGRWVDERIGALDASGVWNPDAAEALTRLRARSRARVRRWRWMGVAAVAVAVAAGAFFSLAPPVCASPLLCATSIWRQVVPARPAPVPAISAPPRSLNPGVARATPARPQTWNSGVAPAAPAPPAGPQPMDAGNYVYQAGTGGYAGEISRSLIDRMGKLEGQSAPTALNETREYKVLGSPTAPITCEIYSDYQCPPCARLYRETVPMLVSEFVQAGKLRLVRRDFPLTAVHPYAQLAAAYANAAGEVGDYDAAAARIFATQSVWSANGDLDSQLAQVLPPADMDKIRGLVRDPTGMEGYHEGRDRAIADQYAVLGTPTLVFLSNGHSQVVTGAILFDPALLKNYINDLLGQNPPAQQTPAPPDAGQSAALPGGHKSLATETYSFNPLQSTKDVTVGDEYLKAGNYKAAAGRFRDATRWNGQNAEAWLRLAEVSEETKDFATVKEAYTEYLKLAPDAKDGSEIRKKLAQLR